MFSPGLLVSGGIQRSLLGSAGILIPAFWALFGLAGVPLPGWLLWVSLSWHWEELGAAELHGWALFKHWGAAGGQGAAASCQSGWQLWLWVVPLPQQPRKHLLHLAHPWPGCRSPPGRGNLGQPELHTLVPGVCRELGQWHRRPLSH